MTATEEYIKKINVSNFKGTICLSEKEFERHLSMFAYQRVMKYNKWSDEHYQYHYDEEWTENNWNEFLKEEEHEKDTK